MTRRTRHRPPPRMSVAAANAAYRLQAPPAEPPSFRERERETPNPKPDQAAYLSGRGPEAPRGTLELTDVEPKCPRCNRPAVWARQRQTGGMLGEVFCAECEHRARLDEFAPTPVKPRKVKPPAPSESESHQALREWIDTQWWRKGVMRPESQASRGWREQAQLKDEGGDYTSGIPDWMGGVPECKRREVDRMTNREVMVWEPRIDWALELKAVDAIAESTKAKLEPEWWLRDVWPWQAKGEVWNDRGLHNALTWAQARRLRSLAARGHHTMVAYGHDEAIAWLDKLIGPRPAVEPEWGW